MSPEQTHIIPCSSRPNASGLYVSLCDQLVSGTCHSPLPSCVTCQRIDAEDYAAIEALQADLPERPQTPLTGLVDAMDLGYALGRGNPAGVADALARFSRRGRR